MSFERNYKVSIISNKIHIYWFFSTKFYKDVFSQPQLRCRQNYKIILALKWIPWFVTGFTDGEGCFYVSIIKNNKSKVGWYVKHFFQIGLHEKDKSFLEDIKNFLGVGTISKHGSESFQLKFQSIKDIKKLVDFLEKYPMITEGCSDF